MKKLITIIMMYLLVLFFASDAVSQIKAMQPTSKQQSLYREVGTFNFPVNDNTKIQTRFYVTREINYGGEYSDFYYKYILYAVSQSLNQGILTSTWFYNNRISINGLEKNFFSTLYVRTTPTAIYFWYTNDTDVNIGITWENSTYDPRNLK